MAIYNYGIHVLCAGGSYLGSVDKVSDLPYLVSGVSRFLSKIATKLPTQLEVAEKQPLIKSYEISKVVIAALKLCCVEIVPYRDAVNKSIPLFVGVGLALKTYLMVDLTKKFMATSSKSDRFKFVCMGFTHIKLAYECFNLMKQKQAAAELPKEVEKTPSESPKIDAQTPNMFTLVLKVIALVIQIRYRPFPTLGGALLGGAAGHFLGSNVKAAYPRIMGTFMAKVKELGIDLSDFGVSNSLNDLFPPVAIPTQKTMQVWNEWCNMTYGITRAEGAMHEGLMTGYMLAMYVKTRSLFPKQIKPPAQGQT